MGGLGATKPRRRRGAASPAWGHASPRAGLAVTGLEQAVRDDASYRAASGAQWWFPGHGPALYWFGAHGGSGATTLATVTGMGTDMVALLPEERSGLALPVVVVARAHAHGLTQAQALAARGAEGGLEVAQRPSRLVGLALVADAPGKLPKPLAELRHLVAGAYPQLWDVPWVEAWRLGDPPDAANTPKALQRLAKELASLVLEPAIDLRARPDRVVAPNDKEEDK
jgi:hypothetical protein